MTVVYASPFPSCGIKKEWIAEHCARNDVERAEATMQPRRGLRQRSSSIMLQVCHSGRGAAVDFLSWHGRRHVRRLHHIFGSGGMSDALNWLSAREMARRFA